MSNYGVNLENYGVEPDVRVENTPMDMLRGFDPELQGAVDEAPRIPASQTWPFEATTSDGQAGVGGTGGR